MAHAKRLFSREFLGIYGVTILAAAFVCAAFATAASGVVAVLFYVGSFGDTPLFGPHIMIKTAIFLIGSGVTLSTLAWIGPSLRTENARDRTTMPARGLRWGFVPAALLAAALFLPNLSRHPWPAPDELHHLIVARNLAEHGAYASGLDPDFVWFDHYDSVGAPVIGLVAAAFKVGGVGLVPARFVLACFGIALTVLSYFLLFPLFGSRASGIGSFLALCAFGTIYLSRSLYGEVPAFVFLMAGLIAWRAGLEKERVGALIAAGVLAGLAILSKPFLLVAALAVAGVYIFDQVTYRRIWPRHILIPAGGAGAVLGVWQAVEFAARDLVADDKPSLMLYYRHSLTFGMDQVFGNFGLIGTAIPALVLGTLAIGAVVPRIFRAQYDPALAVLVFMAPLFVFWYAFFTPMHLPRYLWYPAVIAALFCGPLIDRALSWRERSRGAFALRAALVVLLAWVYIPATATITYKVFTLDQAGADQALARYVAGLPPNTRIATTYWPAERLLNFLGERRVEVLTPDEIASSAYDVLIDNDQSDPPLRPDFHADGIRFGPYLIYRTLSEQVASVAPSEIGAKIHSRP